MTQVVIQPSYGNPAARRHWAHTLDQEIPFAQEPYRSVLTADQLSGLLAIHPAGSARFWGASARHDTRMETLTHGDVVLFTGQKLVRAVGEVGAAFRNARLADLMWTPDPDSGSFRNVYSLQAFETTAIPYEEVWQLPGFNAGDNFMGLRFLNDDKGYAVLSGLRIHTTTEGTARAAAERETAKRLLQSTRSVALEAVNVVSTSYDRSAGPVLVNRVEALLVQVYGATLPATLEVNRLRTPVGITDLHITGPGLVEVLEAKAGADHQYVRAALGQLLDYALYSPEPPTRLTALFPSPPQERDIELLHRYAIDCVWRQVQGEFVRDPAPPDRLPRMHDLWRK